MNPTTGVSVVVPVYNGEHTIRPLIESLLGSAYPADAFEIIVVDNGSTDATCAVVREYPVTLLEQRAIRSSYAARNMGIGRARFPVIAFTDADCQVDAAWIAEGIRALEKQGADLIAGRIEFTFSSSPSAAELYDSMVHMRNDVLVATRHRAVTANLFVPARLFAELGRFPEFLSGGDGVWTARAVERGCALRYAPEAVVRHQARPFREVVEKAMRVGSGFREATRNLPRGAAWGMVGKSLLPPAPGAIRRLIQGRGTPSMERRRVGLWGMSYIYGLAWAYAAAVSLLKGDPGPTAGGGLATAEHRAHPGVR